MQIVNSICIKRGKKYANNQDNMHIEVNICIKNIKLYAYKKTLSKAKDFESVFYSF